MALQELEKRIKQVFEREMVADPTQLPYVSGLLRKTEIIPGRGRDMVQISNITLYSNDKRDLAKLVMRQGDKRYALYFRNGVSVASSLLGETVVASGTLFYEPKLAEYPLTLWRLSNSSYKNGLHMWFGGKYRFIGNQMVGRTTQESVRVTLDSIHPNGEWVRYHQTEFFTKMRYAGGKPMFPVPSPIEKLVELGPEDFGKTISSNEDQVRGARDSARQIIEIEDARYARTEGMALRLRDAGALRRFGL